MKKMFFMFLLLQFALPAFSQNPQISTRLRFEVRYGNITITDVYDYKYITFSFEKAMNYTFYIYYFNNRVGTADIYTNDFPQFIARYITSWSINNGGNDEWRQYASVIADRITQDIRNQNPKTDYVPPATPPSTPPVTPPTVETPLAPRFITNFQTGMCYVQIGAYSNIEKALEIAVKNNIYPVAIMQASVRIYGLERTVFRVLIGPVNYTDSVSYLQQIKLNYHDAFVQVGK